MNSTDSFVNRLENKLVARMVYSWTMISVPTSSLLYVGFSWAPGFHAIRMQQRWKSYFRQNVYLFLEMRR